MRVCNQCGKPTGDDLFCNHYCMYKYLYDKPTPQVCETKDTVYKLKMVDKDGWFGFEYYLRY